MFRQMLRAKIHRATVTESSNKQVDNDEELLAAAGILPGEAIVCSNSTTANGS
ncbi:MAG: aspartate 1-decarboxylase [Nitrospiraceae bacterium]